MNCLECGLPFPESSNPRRKYHEACRRLRAARLHRERNPLPEMRCTADTGAVAELIVCADLLQRGFEVFRAVSPGATCDLIALKEGRSLRVQVRTASVTVTGSIQIRQPEHPERHDTIALVLVSQHIVSYSPELPSPTRHATEAKSQSC
jgi:hypothetical protein